MTPLRVAYLVRYLPSPSETFVLDEAVALREHGVDVDVWVLDRVLGAVGPRRFDDLVASAHVAPRPSRPAAWWATLSLPPGATTRRVRAEWVEHARPRDFRRVAWLARGFARAGIDVVRIHHAAETARYGVAAAQLCGARASVAVHARDLFRPVPDFDRILRTAAHVSTITPFHRERILRGGLPPEQVQLLPCAVPLPPQPAEPPSDDGPLRVLSVGRLVPKKGHDLLLEACGLLARSRAVHLTLVGDGDEGARLRRQVHRLSAAHPTLAVETTGSLPSEDVAELILRGRYHAFALACRVAEDGDRDGLPVSLLEAAAAGLPIVTSAMPAFEFEFAPGPGARLVPLVERDGATEPEPSALAAALADLHDAGLAAWSRGSAEIRSGAARRATPSQTAGRLAGRLAPLASGVPSAPRAGTWERS